MYTGVKRPSRYLNPGPYPTLYRYLYLWSDHRTEGMLFNLVICKRNMCGVALHK